MDRRAAGALLALAACIACSAAAPTTSNHTALDLYEGASDGCYYNFQHYGEGDRIMTNEPCLNCTCHNRMLMCYLRVCPFTKPIGQDCTVEKRADQCCPIVTCPDVPVDLLTSTSTTSPAEYGATGLGKLDKYGCSINGKYFPEGSKVPPTPNKPCEHCYCIRNMTTCVMQECTLHVDGCTPIYHKDVCCPIRYSCDHSEDEIPLLDDMSTTVRPTPGFLLTTTTMSPVTQMSQDCVHNDQIIADGASITTEKACEHCYCMKGDIVCVVQECGAPMENEGKNCTSLPPREGQCCPDTYICEGDELSTDVPNEITTEGLVDKLTTLSPPRRSGDEGSGYRNEPSETTFTENPSLEPDVEGSGEESDGTTTKEELEALTSAKPFVSEEITTNLEDNEQYIPVTTKANDEKSETSTMAVDEPTQEIPKEVTSDLITKVTDNNNEQITSTISSATERLNQYTTEAIDSLNTVPDVLPEKESEVPHEQTPHTLGEAKLKEPQESDDDNNKAVTMNAISDVTSGPDNDTPMEDTPDKRITDEADVIPEQATEKEDLEHASDQDLTTTKGLETVTDSEIMEENETPLPEEHKTTNIPLDVNEQSTTEPNLAQNTVISAEEENEYVHTMAPEKTEIRPETETTAQPQAETDLETEKQATTQTTVLRENEPTAEPDKGLNTIPSEVDEQTNPQPSLMEITTSSVDSKTTEPSDIFEKTSSYETEKSPTSMDTSTETHITKVVQNTVTTEPSFRKEDEATENSKPEFGSTTIKTEFVDEGFIPTQDEKLSTGADVLSTDDEITTMVPEYEKESEATVAQVQHTTESILETSVSSVTVPEKVADAITQPEGASSTEKSPDVTTSVAELETHEEPSRIPGEGDCLLDGVTYRNNTIVPSTSNCHTGCRCTSSVIKCDPIICSPPPDYMSNCQSIYDTPDSCCPTYICDHPRETVPPQSDNQMSGTETPIASPTIECRGDQCELSASTKPTPEPCISGDCGSDHDDKTETGECGPKGCADSVKEPVSLKPSDELSACKDGKCESPEQDCADGKCQSLPTSSQQPPVKSCDGDVCTMPAEENLSPQPCENGHDCNKIEMPVSQTSSDVLCVGSECDSKVTTSPSQQEICNEKDGCKPVEKITADCDNDKLCIRKETVPSKCTGEECLKETELPPDGEMSKLSTTATEPGKISLNEATETIVPSDEDNLYESTQTPITDHNKPTPTPGSEQEEKVPDTEEDVKEEPNTTKSTNEIEKNTDISTLKEEMTTLKPDKIQIVDDIETTQTPEAVNVEKTDKESTQQPDETSQEQTTSHPNIKEDITNAPEQYTTKISETSEEAFTTVPNVPQEYTDKSPSIQEEQTDQPQPSEDASKDKDIPLTTEEVEIKMPESEKEFDVKVSAVEKESTTLPAVNKEYGDNLTEMPETTKKDQETLTTYTSSEMPGKIETQTSEPISITATDSVNKNTEVPTSIDKLNDNEILNEDDKIKASQGSEPTDVIEDDKEKVSTTDDTKVPVVTDEQSYVPVAVTEDATEAPIIADHSDKPTLIEEDNKIVPDATETGADNKTPTQEPEKESTESTPPIDISTAGPIVVSDALTEQMNIETSSPVVVTDKAAGSSEPSDTITETPDIKIEHTNAPVVIAEETTDTPQYGTDDTYQTLSPDEQDTKISDEHMDKTETPINEKEKPILVEEELPEKPTDLMETVEKKPELIETDGITEPVNIEESVTESTEVSEDNSKTPLLIDETEPYEMTVNTDKSPTVTEHTSPVDTLRETDEKTEAKPVDNADTSEASSGAGEDHTFASLPTEHSNKPDISETHTSAPDSNMSEITETMPDEEKSVTKAPVTDVTKSDQEMISPESSVEEHTETTGTVIEKVTIAPTYESQVTGSEGSLEPNLITGDLVEESSKSPDEQRQEPSVTESQDSTTSGPQEVTTQSVTKLEETKKQTLQEEEGTTYHPSKQTMSENKPTEVPETITTTESIEKITKSSENEIADDHAESFTSIPEQKSTISGTESPMDEITKLNEREQSEVPKETENNQAVEDTTSKQLEEVNTKPSPPESHTTETTPESESASIIPETDKATEPAVEDNVHNIASSDNVDETKDKQPDNLIPEKDDTITSAIDAAVMTTPTVDVTEAKDTLSTSQENTSVTEETTEERIEQSTTKEIDNDNLDFSLSSTKATTHSETESTERYETPTTPRSSEVLEDTSLSSKPISVEPNRRTEIGSAPETGMDVSEEKTTKMPYPTEHSDLSTAEPQTPVNDEQLSTVDTESVKPTSEKPEQPKTTESSNIEPNRDVDQEEHETDDTDKEHKIPETPMTSDSDSLGPVTEGEVRISSTENPESMLEIHSDSPQTQVMTETPLSLVTEPDVKVVTEKEGETETVPVTETEPQKQSTEKEDVATNDLTTSKTPETSKPAETTMGQMEYSETTPYLIELEEHTHKIIDDIATVSSTEKEQNYETTDEITSSPSLSEEAVKENVQKLTTSALPVEEHTSKIEESLPTLSTSAEDFTQKVAEETSSKLPSVDEDFEKVTQNIPEEVTLSSISDEITTVHEKESHQTTVSEPKETDAEVKPVLEQTTSVPAIIEDNSSSQKEITTSKITDYEETTPAIVRDSPEKIPITESEIKAPVEDEFAHPPTTLTDESKLSTTKPTTVKQEDMLTPSAEDKYSSPEEKPTSEAVSPSANDVETKPQTEIEPTDEIPAPEDEGLSPSVSGYGEPDYAEEDQAFGPGTCRYGGKVYVSAQQIPRDDPCDFCFCFRSDIICLQQSCPPPIHGCHEEPIQGFCCPRYECPVSMATTVNVTTTTTTTTTTLPPHFPTHGYKGAAQRRGCQIKGHTYKVGEVVRSSSGPCLHCTCGGDGQMKCDPKACTPEPMLRQMIAAAVSAKRRR